MLLIDAHLDLAFNALSLKRDLTMTVREGRIRDVEYSSAWKRFNGTLTTTLPELREHMPAIVCGTIFILPVSGASEFDGQAYSSPAQAYEHALAQLAWYQAMAAAGHIRLISTLDQFEAICQEQPPYGAPGLLLLMEGADGLRSPADLEHWHAAGLRWLGLAWRATRYSGGTHDPGGLTELGRELISEMNRLHVALDASHLAEASFWEALDLIETPVAASHSNCRALLEPDPGARFLSDEMIKAILQRDGVIGLAIYNRMLERGWDYDKPRPGLEVIRQHIEHICDLAGDTLHVALGSDFDGGFGVEGIPAGLDKWGDLRELGPFLQRHGWADQDIANVLGANWQRWLTRVLKSAE